MSDKKEQLLNESTVRRFMGLAGIGALTEKFVEDKDLNEVITGTTTDPGTAGFDPDASVLDEPVTEQLDDEVPPMPGEMAEPGPEDELPLDAEEVPGEEGVEDVDLSQEEADVLISLGKKLEAEVVGDEEVPPEEAGMPPEGEMPPGMMGPPPMAESLIHELTARVSKRIKKEYIVNEVMKRVAKRLHGSPERKKK